LFETLALGLASDGPAASVLAASIGIHQPAESLALLVTFMKTSMKKRDIMKWLSMYSAVGPVGLVLGMVIRHLSDPAVEGVILAVTAGTFLYVGATEVCLIAS
jgi:solute carrier family 39 (zinc transporter), member 1/2/3